MPFSARVLLDSASPAGIRLTTMEIRYPRFIHSELMTHRTFCLGADTQLYFDLPSGQAEARRFTMPISEFYEKWTAGAALRPNKRRIAQAGAIDHDALYSAREAAMLLGYRHYTSVNDISRRSAMKRVRGKDGRYRLRGSDLIAYAKGTGVHRYSLRGRLGRMRLRSCDESTREIYHTRVQDVCFSGHQPVYRVTTSDGKTILASAEHRFLGERGWSTLREAASLALSPAGIATWIPPVRLAVNGIDPLRDPDWLREMRDRGFSAKMIAERSSAGQVRLRRAYRPLRKRARIAHFVDVVAIEYVGIRPTYDLEVEGPYHNFVADGFIVHNSRNAASSRAIPIRKMIEAVRDEPAMPLWWGRNQSGMQANVEVGDAAQELARAEWRRALEDALGHAERLAAPDINLHKQLVNRILEPFAWITVIVTATEWANFFTQRTHEDAQPELKHIAQLMLEEYRASEPRPLEIGEWHSPLILPDEAAVLSLQERLQISVARCARVSYLSHDGTRDRAKDVELYEKLVGGGANGHWSPFEHVATPLASAQSWSGNFRGWEQFRKRFPQEHASTLPAQAPAAALR
jgi:thymidylate synthase ThyX